MALHSLYCADVPLRNCSLTNMQWRCRCSGVRCLCHGTQHLPWCDQRTLRTLRMQWHRSSSSSVQHRCKQDTFSGNCQNRRRCSAGMQLSFILLQMKVDPLYFLWSSSKKEKFLSRCNEWVVFSSLKRSMMLAVAFGTYSLWHWGTEWPFMCWCAIKKLLTHWLTYSLWRNTCWHCS